MAANCSGQYDCSKYNTVRICPDAGNDDGEMVEVEAWIDSNTNAIKARWLHDNTPMIVPSALTLPASGRMRFTWQGVHYEEGEQLPTWRKLIPKQEAQVGINLGNSKWLMEAIYRDVPTCPFRDYLTYDKHGIYDAGRFITVTFWCEGNTTKGEIAGAWHGGPTVQFGSPILMERPIGIIRLANGASSTVDLDDYIQSDVTGTITYQMAANSQTEGSGAGAASGDSSEALVSASIAGSELTLTAALAGQGAVELYFIATDAEDNSIKGLVELTVEEADATPAPTPTLEPTPEPTPTLEPTPAPPTLIQAFPDLTMTDGDTLQRRQSHL